MNFRTTLEQAGRIAGLAGELDVTEAEVMRRLLDRALAQRDVLRSLRAELARDSRARRRAAEDFARRDGLFSSGTVLVDGEPVSVGPDVSDVVVRTDD